MLYPDFDLQYWQKEAVEAVLGALSQYGPDKKQLGIVSMPAGTGKTVLLTALFSRLLQWEEKHFSILLLTSRAGLASWYLETFSEQIGLFYSVEIAETRKALAEKVAVPGTILISTAQKLWGEERPQDERISREPLAPFSMSSCLLQDGILRMIEYYCVDSLNEGAVPSAFMNAPQAGFLNTEESYRNKAKLVIQCFRQSEKDTFSLLLCKSHSDAIAFYQALKAHGGNTEIEIYFNLHPRNNFSTGNKNFPEGAQWNGQRFHGMVIACSPLSGSIPFDLVFAGFPNIPKTP